MKYTVTIEEHISGELSIEAENISEAMDKAGERYLRGELALEPGSLTAKLMMARCDSTGETTEWEEF